MGEQMKPRPITAVFALRAVCALAMPSTANAGRMPAGRTPVSKIEAIVDDSRPMSITDPARPPVAPPDLLSATPRNEAITCGAVEFGGALFSPVRMNRVTKQPVSEPAAADTLFPPEPIGPNAGAMQATLSEQVRADKGNTDYNAAFARAKAD